MPKGKKGKSLNGWVHSLFRFQYAFQHLPFTLNFYAVQRDDSLKRELFLRSILILLMGPSWSWSYVQLHLHWQLSQEPTGQDSAEKERKFIL